MVAKARQKVQVFEEEQSKKVINDTVDQDYGRGRNILIRIIKKSIF